MLEIIIKNRLDKSKKKNQEWIDYYYQDKEGS